MEAIQNGSHYLLYLGMNYLGSSLTFFKFPSEVKAGLIATSYNKVAISLDWDSQLKKNLYLLWL